MKKIFNLCILLLSLFGCSNNVSSNISSTCSCVKNPVDQNSKLTFKMIKNIDLEDITAIECYYPSSSLRTKIENDKFDEFYYLLNREYTKVDNNYLEKEFNYIKKEAAVCDIYAKNHYLGGVSLNNVFDEKNIYFVIPGAKESYLSIPISKEECNELL